MKVQNDKWNLFEHENLISHQQTKRMADVLPEKDRTIQIDTASFSKEGLFALHGQTLKGQVDVEEIKKLEKYGAKLKYNLTDDFVWAMRNDMSNALNNIKAEKGSYNLEDLITIRMEAYEKQYNSLQKAYENGTRDICVDDGFDENGKWLVHEVTWEEDVEYLNKAFAKIADSLAGTANAQQLQWNINEIFGGERPLSVTLPENYDKKLADILKRAANDYVEQKNAGQTVSASALALRYLNENTEYAQAMKELFSTMKPMP